MCHRKLLTGGSYILLVALSVGLVDGTTPWRRVAAVFFPKRRQQQKPVARVSKKNDDEKQTSENPVQSLPANDNAPIVHPDLQKLLPDLGDLTECRHSPSSEPSSARQYKAPSSSPTPAPQTASSPSPSPYTTNNGSGSLLPLLFGKTTRVVVRHDDDSVTEKYTFDLDPHPGLASAMLLESLGAGDYLLQKVAPVKWMDRIASRVLSRRSRSAIFTIIEIIQTMEDHGVVDLFAKHTQAQIFWALVAYSGLQKTIDTDDNLRHQYHDTENATMPQQQSQSARRLHEEEPELLDNLAHYAVYASAAYGWKLGFAMKGTTLFRKITKGNVFDKHQQQHHHKTHSSPKDHPQGNFWNRHVNGTHIHLPNVSISDTSFFLRRTGRSESDIVAVEWGSDTHRPGYVIARDPERKTLVFSIRGTWSFHDVLTDLCCTKQNFSVDDPMASTVNEDGDHHHEFQFNATAPMNGGKGDQDDLPLSLSQRLWNWFYSSSSLKKQSSSWMRSRDKDIHAAHHGMLEAAQGLVKSTEHIVKRELRDNPDYSLVIVGHSMGGGCAALLGTLWSETFPVKVFVYGPPCISPLNARALIGANATTEIVSVIVEGDPFGSISLGHIAELTMALDRLCADQRLRERVLQSTLFRRNDRKKKKQDSWWLLHTMRYLNAKFSGQEKLYPPGRLLLLKQETQRHKLRRKRWTVQDIPPSYFAHLQIRPGRLDLGKHMPSLYEEALNEVSD